MSHDDVAVAVVLFLQFGLPLLLLFGAWFVGRLLEKRHYTSIRARERQFLHQPAMTTRFLDDGRQVAQARLALGSVVVSVDHFKRFLAAFRKIFGGELRSYSPVIDRGRREAVLRMKESVPGAHAYLNTRLETSTISNGKGKTVGTVEVICYATAVTYADEPPAA